MMMSMVEGNQSHQVQCCESSSFENTLRQTLPKFSLNMKNYCSIHLRLLHNLNEDRLHDIFMLNPDCQIKFLERNLNVLSKKPGCNDFKISSAKSNSCSVKTFQKELSLSGNELPSLKFSSLPRNGSDEQFRPTALNSDFVGSKDTMIFDGSKTKVPFLPQQNGFLKKHSLTSRPIVKIKDKYSGKMKQGNYSLSTLSNASESNIMFKPLNENKSLEGLKKKNDTDNQFEFTVEEEKIVSFVCSPPPSRKQIPDPSKSEKNCDSDEESVFSSSKCSSETASNKSFKSSHVKNMSRKEKLPMWDHVPKTNKLLWHPPPTSKYSVTSSVSRSVYSTPSFNRQIKQSTLGNCINFQGTVSSICTVSSDQSLRNSLNQETMLFREAALRGCYNIESVLKDLKSPLLEVEQEVNQVKGSIFSAVRLQRDNDNVVPDCILSIVDICKSWIKLNAHFERKDFKEVLELNGIDLAIFSDFSQWQCMSRIFIDKLINILRKVSLCKDPNISQFNPTTKQGFGMNEVNPTFSRESKLNTCTNDVSNLYTLPSTDIQGKHWKQRRFLSDKMSFENGVLKNKRLCKSNLTMSSSVDNSPLTSTLNSESMFGQGDNGLSLAQNFPKINYPHPNKNCPAVQGDVSLLSTGPKQQNFLNTGFFDKNINIFNTKYNVREDTSMCSITPPNELCTSMASLVDFPVNNHFHGNTQPLPTVPPLYNNPFYLLNHNEYQPNYSQCLIKPNPIHCIDTDVGENCIKSSYMKPGSYNPPQKPLNFQKVINNNIPIEDTPVIGIPFLYSASQSTPQQPKLLEISNGPQITKDNSTIKAADDTWETALSMAGTFRNTMMADKINNGPNLKISETVSLKSHFLLSDGNSQDSSSSGGDFKLNSDSEELSFPNDGCPSVDLPVVRAKSKTTDWLIKSLSKISLENENISKSSMGFSDALSENELTQVSQSSEESNKQELENQTDSLPNNVADAKNGGAIFKHKGATGTQTDAINSLSHNESPFFQKKLKKTKKNQDDYTSTVDYKPPVLYKKPKYLFKRSVTKQITCQLEDILNCIWNTKVTTLIDENMKSEKEITRLELKVRSPLYLQAMRCKLTNQSYDTLDQALSDFQQYFTDIRSRNKGDKQCTDVVSALEQIFFDLVEKHFGLTYQPSPQYFGPVSLSQMSVKPRRPKKSARRS